MYSIKLLYLCYYILKKKKKRKTVQKPLGFLLGFRPHSPSHTHTHHKQTAHFSILIRLVIWFIYSYIKANKAFVGIYLDESKECFFFLKNRMPYPNTKSNFAYKN